MTKQKPQLLFIHGFRGSHLGLKATSDYFAERRYEVFAPDLPPTVSDEALPKLDSFTAESYATWVANYILEHKLDHPILIGHSMGSIICAATAAKFPELINDKIVFLSPIAAKPPRAIGNLSSLCAVAPNKFVGWVCTKYLIVPKDKKTLRDVLDITYECSKKFTSKLDVARAAIFSSSHCIADFDFEKDAAFIAGEKDRLNKRVEVRRAAKKYNGKVVFIKGAGHLVNYEKPLELAEAIEEFLNQKPEK